MGPAREVAHEFESKYYEDCPGSRPRKNGHSDACDRLTAAIEADRRELVEACAKLCDVSADTFCPDVDPAALFVGGARLAGVRIRALIPKDAP